MLGQVSVQIDAEKPVLVTGASGYVASWIIRYLLEDGYTVRGTVRNPDNPPQAGGTPTQAEDE